MFLISCFRGRPIFPCATYGAKISHAIRYVMRSGCQWRLLPKEFPPWQTVYDYYLRWRRKGKWQEIHDALVIEVRKKQEKRQLQL